MPNNPTGIVWDSPAPAQTPKASAPQFPGVIRGAPDPQKARDQQLQEVTTATNIKDTAHDNAVTDVKNRIGNPQDLRKEFDALPEVKSYKVAVQQLGQALGTGEGAQADLALTYAFAKAMDPDSVVRESEQAGVASSQAWLQAAAENIKKQFGMDGAGVYSPEARAKLRQQIIRAVASRNKLYLASRNQFGELAKRNNIDPYEVIGDHIGEQFRPQFRQYDDNRRAEGANIAPLSGTQPTPDIQPPTFDGGGDPMRAATGETRRVDSPELTAQLDRMMRSGAPLADINKFLSDNSASPIPEGDYTQMQQFLRKNPGYKGPVAEAFKIEPQSTFDRVISSVGDSPVGAYFVNAGQFLSGNTLDNMAADPARARASIDMVSEHNPNAATAGQISGGVLASMGGEALLARGGMAAGMGRSVLADTAMGAANGAGMADAPGQSRGMNALLGGGTAAAGSVAGNVLTRGVANALAPSGGAMQDLYAAGIRPTPGQRFANSGVIGNTLNKAEQSLQSIPVTGSMVAGARQEARDQFQTGAFNEALKEVGEQLPKGMKPGTDPHTYAQATFKRVYSQARNGMNMVVDQDLSKDIAAMAPDINTLGPQDLAQFKSIVANRVNSKLVNGQAGGEAYKKMVSGLERSIGQMKSNPNKQELYSVLTDLKFAIENAARRHSTPEAVQLLDAADAGYAKLVRIEEAASRVGGDAGTFTPKQFERAVQKTEGGIRSKPYLRGDALMHDFAKQGSGLSETLPNSGTADRLSLLRLGLAALTSPVALAYSPGVRKVMGAAMAPAGPRRTAISAQLKKRAALVGKAGAGAAAAALQGTNPGQ